MEAIQVALLALTAMLAGMVFTVMLQFFFAVRQLRTEIHDTRARIEPLIDRLNGSNTQLASAVAFAVAAGIRAFRDAHREASSAQPEREGSP
jgi:hypothetical protein